MRNGEERRPLISVCVCTFKRPEMLAGLLRSLESQRTDDLFDIEIIVADNDAAESGRSVVEGFAARAALRVRYCVERAQNIALARNKTVTEASGALIAFIDDDELPTREWLYRLFQARRHCGADGALGPVLPKFEPGVPSWVRRGGFFDRPRHKTGHVMDWRQTRTGNVLLSKESFRQLDPPFRAQFGNGGEDVDFFRRLIGSGRKFVWSDEAIVYESIPAYRCTRRFLAGRALLRGSNFPRQSGRRAESVVKSLIAVPCYAVALPVFALLGQHKLMAYSMKLLEHGSRLLSLAGLPVVTERQT